MIILTKNIIIYYVTIIIYSHNILILKFVKLMYVITLFLKLTKGKDQI